MRLLVLFLILCLPCSGFARPTQSGGQWEGLEVNQLVSPQGNIKVWWVSAGPDAVPAADQNDSGIPDFVEYVASEGDAIYAYLEMEGWRRPLEDTLVAPAELVGGDGLLDVYLVDFRAGDGQFVRSGCLPSGSNTVCAGYMLLENDFRGSYYATYQEGIGVVLSHELFHGVQLAYTDELELWWSEGTATWFEEAYNPEQRDFEALSAGFFANHERPLNDRPRGPTDGYAYNTALFPYVLSLIFDNALLRDIFERMDSPNPMPAIEASLEARGATLSEAMQVFFVFNGLTGARANPEAYPQAESFPMVDTTFLPGGQRANWDVEAVRLSARYGIIRPARATSFHMVSLLSETTPELLGVQLGVVGLEVHTAPFEVEEDSHWLLIVANSGFDTRNGRVEIRPVTQTTEPDPEPEPEPEPDPEPNSASDSGCSHGGVWPLFVASFLTFPLWARRRST